MGITFDFYKAKVKTKNFEKITAREKFSQQDVDDFIELTEIEAGHLEYGNMEMAANDIFQRIIETNLFSEEEKYKYYTFFANLFWFQYESYPDEKYVIEVKRNDLEIFGINKIPDYGQSKYNWRGLKFAKNVDTLKSIIDQGSKIDFEKLEYMSIHANIGWEFFRISTFNGFKKYTMDWLNLYSQCIEEEKWLIAEYP